AEGRPLAFAEQDDAAATYAEKIEPRDRLLDPAHTAVELERRVRALHPHIGTHVALAEGTLLGVQRAAVVEAAVSGADPPAADGRGEGQAQAARGVRASGERLLLDCREGVLELLVVQPPGGRPMDAASYLRGHRLS